MEKKIFLFLFVKKECSLAFTTPLNKTFAYFGNIVVLVAKHPARQESCPRQVQCRHSRDAIDNEKEDGKQEEEEEEKNG